MERGLYIVPTPIGNLGDITHRALETLAAVTLIAAEDTRHSKKLLAHYGIETPLWAYHDHSSDTATQQLLARMASGDSVALISDAGTPLVSDPGFRLVRSAQDSGIRVFPLPGPCAAVTALSGAGLPTDRFFFEGFLPAKSAARRHRLESLAHQSGTLVIYEAPHRIAATLGDAVAILGEGREAVLARELSKSFETIRRGALGELLAWVTEDVNQQRGEQVLLLGPVADAVEPVVLSGKDRALLFRLAEELPPRKAAAIVADLSGLRTRDLYKMLTERDKN
ncbi:MAG: 16S rRNA (cytidine(1402)-2'-O)-methyltransferase [Luminiphilus sp.]|nr:16S rRNA (cytidine(1402)-2'-O)-methyltransferase [Luminiphilus sp.]